MSILPTNAAQTIAGVGQAERIATRDIAKKDADKALGRKAVRDEIDLVVVNVESPEAIRSLKGNSEEETREDKQEHPGYNAPASGSAGIDVQA
ncbi:MAG: hypothetical protein KF787_07170 [Phycisphaeraceae bacterium]|nr:hypothetical protein [Phycisphaerae bacterium]MBX3392414.1 hypothetical protein [Phycisphaeraceae bacterium]HRJ49059.1 hypothetical protein [Phycisphaerales bacterium]